MNKGEGFEESTISGEKRWACAVTLNPNFLSDVFLQEFEKWAKKHTSQYSIVTEKEDSKRHIHCTLLLQKWRDKAKGRRLDRVKASLWEMQQKFDESVTPESKNVTFGGVKIIYNYDWENKYMKKGDSTVEIARFTPEKYDEFLPSASEQLEAIRKAEERKNAQVKDHFFNKLAKLWDENNYTFSECHGLSLLEKRQAALFLEDMMFEKQLISVIRDLKSRKQIVDLFPRYYLRKKQWEQYFTKDELEQIQNIDNSLG
jgi:hypothetical protein